MTYAVWRKKFLEVLHCQSFMCVNSSVLTLKVIIPNLYVASRGLTFATRLFTEVHVKYKRALMSTLCVCGNLQTDVFSQHCT